jgi:hypothetical protein
MRLATQLAAFDPQFFDEIEDLKGQHRALTQDNARLRGELKRLANEHGIQSTVAFLDDVGGP